MTRRDTRETGPSGRRFGATELPPEIERVVQQAKRLEWATLGVIVVTIVLVAVVMGSSQAMRAAWIEDLLSLIPPIAFLVALRVARMAPTRARPYGSHRSVGVGHLVAAVALSVMGVVLVGDSLLGLVTAEHPPIGTFHLFGHTVWQGWFMMAVMALSVPGPMILGHKKLRLAEQLHDRVLYADADMNKADWQTGVATIVGVAGIGLGWWWADSAAAIFVGVSIVLDGWKNLKEAVRTWRTAAPPRSTAPGRTRSSTVPSGSPGRSRGCAMRAPASGTRATCSMSRCSWCRTRGRM